MLDTPRSGNPIVDKIFSQSSKRATLQEVAVGRCPGVPACGMRGAITHNQHIITPQLRSCGGIDNYVILCTILYLYDSLCIYTHNFTQIVLYNYICIYYGSNLCQNSHQLRSIADAFEHTKEALLASSHPEAHWGVAICGNDLSPGVDGK